MLTIRSRGKTGTAQILENGHYARKYITSFVGYFPAQAPNYTAIVVVKNPKGVYQYGYQRGRASFQRDHRQYLFTRHRIAYGDGKR
ncbi:MAG: penicillin-binding transpeptidase domain-containing protein [Bacteroidota bacterium]